MKPNHIYVQLLSPCAPGFPRSGCHVWRPAAGVNYNCRHV